MMDQAEKTMIFHRCGIVGMQRWLAAGKNGKGLQPGVFHEEV